MVTGMISEEPNWPSNTASASAWSPSRRLRSSCHPPCGGGSPIDSGSLAVGRAGAPDRPDPDAAPRKRERGRPVVYPDRLFLKALVVMLLRRLPNVHLLYTVLRQPTPEMAALRAALAEQ